ncbi:MAG: hypothetical protein R3B68_14800 [Phycisphaerales bacterium]
MPRPKTPAAPRCPRCGYDQSGAIAAFTDACPTTGTCSECGLDFRWRDVLSPAFGRVPWLFEHARGAGVCPLIASLLMTAGLTRFWSRVRMSHAVHPGRLWLMLGIVLIGMHLFTGVSRVACQLRHARLGDDIRPPSHGTFVGYVGENTWSDAWSIVSDGGKPLVVLANIVDAVAPVTYEAWWRDERPSMIGVPSRWLPALHIFAPLLLLALPHTRAIAKVRPAHLLRASAYPLALVATLWYAGLLGTRWYEAARAWYPGASEHPPPWLERTTLAVGIAWAGWWWWLVCHTYLRLPRPRLVWCVVFAVSLIATAAVFASVNNRLVGYALRDLLL